MYAFVGISGMAKMSSSKGGVPTPADALKIMEPQLLRWLYARRRPNQSFKIAFDQEIQRLYDEWDKLDAKVADGSALPGRRRRALPRGAHRRAVSCPARPRPLPYRTLASVADITAGARGADAAHPQRARPGATRWPPWTRPGRGSTGPRPGSPPRSRPTSAPSSATSPTPSCSASLDEQGRESLRLLLDGLDAHWSLDGLTHLVYGVPKVQAGFAAGRQAQDCRELKTAQRSFFALLYHLLVGRDTGPRLPTLLLAVGAGPGAEAARASSRRRDDARGARCRHRAPLAVVRAHAMWSSSAPPCGGPGSASTHALQRARRCSTAMPYGRLRRCRRADPGSGSCRLSTASEHLVVRLVVRSRRRGVPPPSPSSRVRRRGHRDREAAGLLRRRGSWGGGSVAGTADLVLLGLLAAPRYHSGVLLAARVVRAGRSRPGTSTCGGVAGVEPGALGSGSGHFRATAPAGGPGRPLPVPGSSRLLAVTARPAPPRGPGGRPPAPRGPGTCGGGSGLPPVRRRPAGSSAGSMPAAARPAGAVSASGTP